MTMKLKAEYKEENVISIAFSNEKSINIDVSGDVDLSEYIKELTKLMNKEVELEFEKFETEDKKLNLIQKTMDEIINSFNDSNNETEEESV